MDRGHWVQRHWPKDLTRLKTLDVTCVRAIILIKVVQAQGTGRSELPPFSFHKTLDPFNSRGLHQIMSRGSFQPKLFSSSVFPPRQASLHFKQRFIPWQEVASRQDFFPSDTGEEDSWKSANGAGFSTQGFHCVDLHLDNQVLQRDLHQWWQFK